MAGRPHVADERPHRESVGHSGADVERVDGDGFSRELRSRVLGVVHRMCLMDGKEAGAKGSPYFWLLTWVTR